MERIIVETQEIKQQRLQGVEENPMICLLTFQGVRFAHRAHQLAKGFNRQAAETFQALKAIAVTSFIPTKN